MRHVNRVFTNRRTTGYVIPMTYGRDLDWARDLLAAGGGELARMGRRVRLYNPRVVGFAEAEGHLPAAVRAFFRAADMPGFVLTDSQVGQSTPGDSTGGR